MAPVIGSQWNAMTVKRCYKHRGGNSLLRSVFVLKKICPYDETQNLLKENQSFPSLAASGEWNYLFLVTLVGRQSACFLHWDSIWSPLPIAIWRQSYVLTSSWIVIIIRYPSLVVGQHISPWQHSCGLAPLLNDDDDHHHPTLLVVQPLAGWLMLQIVKGWLHSSKMSKHKMPN